MSSLLHKYLSSIHSTKRKRSKSTAFGYATSLVLLDFIGLDNYFISEYGQIWNKNTIRKNREGFVTKGFLPLVDLDGEKYPWVRLSVEDNIIWFPVNLLLGWAFYPKTSTEEKHFSIHGRKFIAGTYTADQGQWHTKPDTDSKLYLQFVQSLYNED